MILFNSMKAEGKSYFKIIIALQLCTCLSYPAGAGAGSVLLLRSGDDKITSLVSESFLEKFEGHVQELFLDRASKEDVQAARDKSPEMVVAVGEDAVKPTLDMSPEVPVIYCAVEQALLESILRNNIYSITNETRPADQFRSFREFMPSLKKLGVIFSPGRSGDYIKQAQAAAAESGIELVARPVDSIKDFPAAVREVIPRVDALWALSDPEFCTREAFNYLLLIAFENNVAVLSSTPRLVKSGAVFSYAPDYRGVGERAAGIALEIMNGQAPDSDKVSIESGQPVINQRTSTLLKIEISEELRRKALLY